METDIDDDEGMQEDIEAGDGPQRLTINTISIKNAVKLPAGGGLAQMRAAGSAHRKEFAILRTPLGVVRVSLPHLEVFTALWKLWGGKRARGELPAVTALEIATEMGKTRKGIMNGLSGLRRNGLIRSIRSYVGWADVRAEHAPTELGLQLFAAAETLGMNTSIQIGRNPSAWSARNQAEPSDLFDHAAIIRKNQLGTATI